MLTYQVGFMDKADPFVLLYADVCCRMLPYAAVC